MDTLAAEHSALVNTDSIMANYLSSVLKEPQVPDKRLAETLRLSSVNQWDRSTIGSISVAKLNRLFGRLRRTTITKTLLRTATGRFRRKLSGDTFTVPLQYTDWRIIIGRNSLLTLANISTWVDVWAAIELNQIPDSPTLARLDIPEIQILSGNPPLVR